MPAFTSPLAESLSGEALERFERYVRIYTQAARERTGSPSTPGQLDLGRLLVEELGAIGLADAALDDNGYVTATLQANGEGPRPTIGLIAHVDVSPDAPAAGVEPIVHRDYRGGVIELPRAGTVLDPAAMPPLADKVGEDIVTSSGDTLLGADDKAGIAEIMTALAHLVAHPELPRPHLRIAFTPDEEVGLGASLFDIEAPDPIVVAPAAAAAAPATPASAPAEASAPATAAEAPVADSATEVAGPETGSAETAPAETAGQQSKATAEEASGPVASAAPEAAAPAAEAAAGETASEQPEATAEAPTPADSPETDVPAAEDVAPEAPAAPAAPAAPVASSGAAHTPRTDVDIHSAESLFDL